LSPSKPTKGQAARIQAQNQNEKKPTGAETIVSLNEGMPKEGRVRVQTGLPREKRQASDDERGKEKNQWSKDETALVLGSPTGRGGRVVKRR